MSMAMIKRINLVLVKGVERDPNPCAPKTRRYKPTRMAMDAIIAAS